MKIYVIRNDDDGSPFISSNLLNLKIYGITYINNDDILKSSKIICDQL